jgi:hypothetical protein
MGHYWRRPSRKFLSSLYQQIDAGLGIAVEHVGAPST